MSNALGLLFGNIANAIRIKNGETTTMKPSEFPNKILALNVGTEIKGDGETIAYGSFVPNSDSMKTIEHNLGVIPDVIIVYAKGISGFANDEIMFAEGFSSEAKDKFQIRDYNIASGLNFTMKAGNSITGTNSFGCIQNAGNIVFMIGGGTYKLKADNEYMWVAISGLT